MSEADRLPSPGEPPRRLPELVVAGLDVVRLHWEDDPRRRSPADPPRHRFDDPASRRSVSYANERFTGCVAEVYGDRRVIPSRDADRLLSTLTASRQLRLIRLDDSRVQAAFGLDARISASVEYVTTRAWGEALWTWYPQADGIRYRARHAGEDDTRNVCLFLDRCADDLDVTHRGSLNSDRLRLTRAARAYHLTVLFGP